MVLRFLVHGSWLVSLLPALFGSVGFNSLDVSLELHWSCSMAIL